MSASEAIVADIRRLHGPIETNLEAVIVDDVREVDQDSFEGITGRDVVCMTCQGYPSHPCETYRLTISDDPERFEAARVTITRQLTAEDILDLVSAEGPDGVDLPLTEALGMMRLAEDTLIRERMSDDPRD